MKHIERILMKLLIIHFILLIIGQFFLKHDEVRPHLSKVIRYEGVGKITVQEWLETFSQ